MPIIKKIARHSLLAVLLCSTSISPAFALPSQEEMWRMIQKQQKEIEALKAKLEKTEQKASSAEQKAVQAEKKVVQTEKKVEATSAQVEQVAANGGGGAPGWWQRTSIGGYGEMHYNGLKDGDDQVDFHRFVLLFGHEFNDDI